MEVQPDLSLCLLPEQEGADISPCLDNLFACTDPLSLEVFVPQDVQCGAFQNSSHLHQLDFPFKPAAAFVEEVWQRSKGRYVGLWHSSVSAHPSSLLSLVEFLDDHPDVAVAGPRFFNSDGDILCSVFQRRLFVPDTIMPGWDGLATVEVDWLSGAALVMNRHACDDIRIPASSLGGLWERRLCLRLQQQGWHIFFVHLARVVSRDIFCQAPTMWQRLEDDWQQMMKGSSAR